MLLLQRLAVHSVISSLETHTATTCVEPKDLHLSDQLKQLKVKVRRFCCLNQECTRGVFVEHLVC